MNISGRMRPSVAWLAHSGSAPQLVTWISRYSRRRADRPRTRRRAARLPRTRTTAARRRPLADALAGAAVDDVAVPLVAALPAEAGHDVAHLGCDRSDSAGHDHRFRLRRWLLPRDRPLEVVPPKPGKYSRNLLVASTRYLTVWARLSPSSCRTENPRSTSSGTSISPKCAWRVAGVSCSTAEGIWTERSSRWSVHVARTSTLLVLARWTSTIPVTVAKVSPKLTAGESGVRMRSTSTPPRMAGGSSGRGTAWVITISR